MPNHDPWGATETLDAAQLDPMAARLEQRAREPRFAAMLTDYLDASEIDSADTVLELGCGTGIVARAIAGRPGFRGHVTGVDISPQFVATATQLARQEGLDQRTSFEVGDTRELALASAGYDRVVAHTLLSHVDHPVAILGEARRLLRPGGTIAVFDVDWASLVHDAAGEATSSIIGDRPVGMFFAQPRVMRQMPVLARKAQLRISGSRSYVFAELGHADYALAGIQSLSERLPSSGFATEAQAAAWLAALTEAHEAGEYFGSCNYYAYLLRRD